ncbi:Hypothetical predicted protein [Olea europaea subsp. europaea]|uniref:Uncharacterized protein n=1 Tax=Olea europaea subsp. europaea TaxID=158383 RepID=A0A8S0V8H1_OLEEU|nr:Hypothetical predicted protein [Olea europaea subsp. europaea]
MSERFDRVERKIDLFLQLAGRGGVQSERSEFDDRAFSTGDQQNKEARERDEVIIEECSDEEVTPNKQPEAFPTYDDDDLKKPLASSHVYQPSNEIIVIEDLNSELAVGRGHRVKRRVAVLLFPYTNPLKRRELLNIEAYDPSREVDLAKVEDLNKWLVNASTR